MTREVVDSLLKALTVRTFVPGGEIEEGWEQLGRCLECRTVQRIRENGTLVFHMNPRRGEKCWGTHLMPHAVDEVICRGCSQYVCINSYDDKLLRHLTRDANPCPSSISDDFEGATDIDDFPEVEEDY